MAETFATGEVVGIRGRRGSFTLMAVKRREDKPDEALVYGGSTFQHTKWITVPFDLLVKKRQPKTKR